MSRKKRAPFKVLGLLLPTLFATSALALTELSDDELSEVTGQASLLSIDKYDFGANNFYQVKLNSTVSTSINMDRLLLRDSAGNSQIDIENFSLNGGDESGVSSAVLQNPFVEFAFAGNIDDTSAQARNREIIGIRIGAENMNGYMSLGNRAAVPASQSPTGSAIPANSGLNMFRGYMKTAALRGTFRTLDSNGGFQTGDASAIAAGRTGPAGQEYRVTGKVCVGSIFGGCNFLGVQDFEVQNATMKFPSVILDDNPTNNTIDGPIVVKAGGHVVHTADGNPISQTTIVTDELALPNISFEMTGRTEPVLGFRLDIRGTGSLNGLRAQASVQQDLSYIHRVRLQNNGFSLSAQNRDVQWRGEAVTAKQGWWMHVANEVELGALAIDGVRLPDSSLVQISAEASNILNDTNSTTPEVPIVVSLGQVIGGVFGNVVQTPIGPIPFDSSTPAIGINLTTSQDLGANQNEIRNCWNGALGC